MPSNARKKFVKKLLPDVDALLETHRLVNPNGGGRRALGHITRAGTTTLCAAWELYNEEVVVEAAYLLALRSLAPSELPLQIQQKIARIVKNSKDETAPLRLVQPGWRTVYLDEVERLAQLLNTPKFGNVDELFKKCIGLHDVARDWRHNRDELNTFVRLRGEVSHRGADAQYVPVKDLKRAKTMVKELVADTDNRISEYLRDVTADCTHEHAGQLAWRRN